MRLVKLSALAIVAVVALLTAFWLLQRKLIYLPFDHRVPAAETVLPGAVEVSLETEDGLSIGAWLVPAAGGEAVGTVLVFNGNAGNRAYRAPLARAFAARGLDVLLFDYRGYGGNPGSPSESGLMRDARAAADYLASRDGFRPQRLVYFGESLGAAVAVALALERPPAALILRSPFTSLPAVGKLHYPWLPVGWMLQDRYPSIRRIAEVNSPLLIAAGDRDSIVPLELSRELYEAADDSGKRFVVIDGADHNDAVLSHGERLIEEAMAFLAEETDISVRSRGR